MDFSKLFRSKVFTVVLLGLGAFIILLVIFKAGVAVGFKKAGFSYRWGENYHRNFAGPRGGFLKDLRDQDFMEAHGTFGSILKIDGLTIVISGKDGTEKTILANDNTVVRRFRDEIKLSDLKEGDYIVVIGSPNDAGQIEAKLIRVMPAPLGGSRPFKYKKI
ncbi:MAG: hypothetical protein HYW91_02435 [Candidatus Sungbacteria bacterium]|nr:hypothetical protein [Candidatus Sungbacteria bacterium]